MKKNIIFGFILIMFFIGGILIYDFSDIMNETLMDNKWYLYENDITYIMDFNDNRFEFMLEDGTKLEKYNKCHTYAYNSNTNIVKLNCDIDNDKIYIAKYDEEKLTLTIDGREKHLFSNKTLALIDNFKNENKLTDEDYENILSIKFDENKYILPSNISKIQKEKKNYYLALIRSNITYENALNYKLLENKMSKKYFLINLDELDKKELNILNKKTNLNKYDENIIYLYELGNKKFKFKEEIKIENISEISSYKI